jgi:hypothetical protein
MMLLSDGTVLAQAAGITRDWFRLAPDVSGSYVDGTWSRATSMRDTRLYYASQVLTDGRVVVMGGEYGSGTRSSEIYDPLANTWTLLPSRPLGDIGDTPSEILPDGRVLVSYRFDGRTNIYDPVSNTWTAGATKLRNSRSSEESWMLLPDQSILTVEVFSGPVPHSQKYLPAEDRWVDAGDLPFSLIEGSEIGPGLLLPDGRAFFIGANGRTAFYNSPADPHDPGTWDPGPSIPMNRGAWDVPGAVLPNGKVLLASGPHNYQGPTTIFEFDPVANTYTLSKAPSFSGPPFMGRMLILPSGQLLWTTSQNQLYVYTPDGDPDPSWKPTISDITDNMDGTFLLTGTQLNGINEGAGYGDDAEMSSNYPLVRLQDLDGNVSYARTFSWSNTGVMTGETSVSTYFTLPNDIGPGVYSLSVVANGIASDPVAFIVGGNPSGPLGMSRAISAIAANFAVTAGPSPIGRFTPSLEEAALPATQAEWSRRTEGNRTEATWDSREVVAFSDLVTPANRRLSRASLDSATEALEDGVSVRQ